MPQPVLNTPGVLGSAPTNSFSAYGTNGVSVAGPPPDALATAQKMLQGAQKASFGYFLIQDSVYNPILPVLPRFPPNP